MSFSGGRSQKRNAPRDLMSPGLFSCAQSPEFYRGSQPEDALSKLFLTASVLMNLTSCGSVAPMKHVTILWNPATQEWFCTKCGRTSDHSNVQYASEELDEYDCEVPAVEIPKPMSGESS